MQGQLCFKILSQAPKSLSNSQLPTINTTSHHFSRFPPSFSPKPTSISPFLKSPFSHSWLSHMKNYGFSSNPMLVKHFATTSRVKGLMKNLVKLRVGFVKTQFMKLGFDINRSWSSYNRGWRSQLQGFNTDGVVYGLIIANAAVFMLWRIADRDFMYKNFTISVENFRSRRGHTLITSAFSHIDLEHIVSNMLGLYFFGQNIGKMFGPEYLLKLYFTGAVMGSIFYLVHHAFLSHSLKGQAMWRRDPSRVPGLGASGAVNAIMLLNIFLFPKSTILFDFFIPVPAILLGIILIGKDMLRIMEGDPQIAGSAHLGGATVAAVAWLRYKRRMRF